MGIKEAFDNVAKQYDVNRRLLIPCFDDFYGSAIAIIKTIDNNAPKILDLGIGTGLLSAFILEEYPDAQITGIDMSSKMLEEAEKRFDGRGVELLEGNYLTVEVGCGYDAVVSSLSIHHVEGRDKYELFRKMYGLLNDGGIFINADQVLGSTSNIEGIYRSEWYGAMRDLGVSDELLAASEERMKEDKMSTLQEQLSWLIEAGFADVECWYKNFIFTVYSGRKFV